MPPTPYDGDPTNFPTSMMLPVDGDKLRASTFRPGLEGLADRTAYLGSDLAVREPGVRLTTSHADAYSRVPISDLTSVGSVGLQSYNGDRIPIWDGSKWVSRTIEAIPANALTLSGLTTDKLYDVFAYWTGTAVRLELSDAWTDDTTRADALAWNRGQANWKGLPTKDTDPTRLYVGTFRATGAATTADSKAKRFIWSAYNRVRRTMVRNDPASTWTMATGAWRQANSSAANQVEYVAGFGDASVEAHVRAMAGAGAGSIEAYVGIGIDSTTVNSATAHGGVVTPGSVGLSGAGADYRGNPGAGYHKLVWLESVANGTATFYGTAGAGGFKAGITATVDG